MEQSSLFSIIIRIFVYQFKKCVAWKNVKWRGKR